jgi:hypothetical protein
MFIFHRIRDFLTKKIPDHPLYRQIQGMEKVRTPNLIYNLLKMERVALDNSFKRMLLRAEREEMKIRPEQVRPILKTLYHGRSVYSVAWELCEASETYIL